jgi:hypothetical protein
MPTRPVALDIAGKTVHRSFKSSIRDALHGSALLEEMQCRYNWPDGTLELIDWEAHRQATQLHSRRRMHLVKLCHDILPTGNLVCTYGFGLPNSCPSCHSPDKDFHHVLRCTSPSRVKWRKDFLSTLEERFYAIKTSPFLVEILIGGIGSWLEQKSLDHDDFPPEYQQLLTEQSTIGWPQFFQGRITLQSSLLQQDYYDGFPKVKGRDGPSWSRNILNHIFT